MARFAWIMVAAVLVPQVGRAQKQAEDLLPAGTQLYLRWDGIDAHHDAFAKTALGQTLEGDTGRFVASMVGQLQESVGTALTTELLQGVSPARLMKLRADAAEAPKLLSSIASKGLIIAAEVRNLEPPQGQVTLIFPEIGKNPVALFGAIRLASALAKVEAKQGPIDGKNVMHVDLEVVHVAAWAEGPFGVLTIGTDRPEQAVKNLSGGKARLTSNPLFRRVDGFHDFEASARAFLDIEALVKLGKGRGSDVVDLLDHLGLVGLKRAVFYTGFAGEAERGLMEVDMEGPAKGVVKLVAGKPFRLADVPALPDDVTSWSMTNFDLGILYDLGWTTADKVAHIVARVAGNNFPVPPIPEFRKTVDTALGIDVRRDLLDALDDKFAMYSSPAEGPLNLGQTFLIKVKDAAKFEDALRRALKSVATLTGMDIDIKKRTYQGVELREVHVRQQGFFFVPTYTITGGWLVTSYFPQPVQGYVLRATGKLPVWKPDVKTQAAFDQLPKEMISVSVTDPRPTVKQLLALGPVVAGMVRSFFPDTKFDIGTLPNGLEATRYLFPNVSVVTRTDQMIRQESRSSLELPVDLGGVDNYAIFALFALAGRLF